MGGLAKFDGSNWTIYDSSNSGLINNEVNIIAIDGSGNKWLGVSYGGDNVMVKFDGIFWTTYGWWSPGMPGPVRSLAIDDSGNTWIGAWGELAKFDGSNWTYYNNSNSGLPNNAIQAIVIDGNGTMWIGTDGGELVKFDGSNCIVYNTSNSGMPNNEVLSIDIDGSGKKWLGTYGGGLVKFDGSNCTIYNTSNSSLPSNIVPTLAVDGSGNKWIGSLLESGGLTVFNDDGIITNYETQISGDNVVNIYPNPANNFLTVDGYSTNTSAEVYNISGKLLLSAPLRNNQLDISPLASGLYFIKLSSLEGSVVRKFMKN